MMKKNNTTHQTTIVATSWTLIPTFNDYYYPWLGGFSVAACFGIGAWWMTRKRKRETSFHIKYKVPKPPMIIKIMSYAPKFVRVWFGNQINAPRTPLYDARVTNPTASVYRKEEIVPNTIWRVGYEYQTGLVTVFKELMNIPYGPKEADAIVNNAPNAEIRDLLKQDTKKYKALYDMDCTCGRQGGYLKAGGTDLNFMMVLRLPLTGGLLLYCPVRIHDDLKEWLDTLGPVEWIVIGSESHTMNLKRVIEQYPTAKVIGPWNAERKLHVAGLQKRFDYVTNRNHHHPTTERRSIELIKQQFIQQYDIELIPLDGDSGCDVILLLFRGYLFEVDVVYGHYSGNRLAAIPENQWKSPKNWFLRHYYYDQIFRQKSPNGFLPDYRFQFMDPNDTFVQAMGVNVAQDNCARLFQSLRQLLSRKDDDEIQQVLGVHLQHVISAQDFFKSVDKCWSWLDKDGRSLLS